MVIRYNTKVLHVDDDENQLIFVRLFLEKKKVLNVTSANSPSEALKLLRSNDYDCIVSDYMMPEMDGITFAGRVRETSSIPFILYTGHGSEEVAEAAFAAGIDDYVRKEIDPSHYQFLEKRISSVIEKRRMKDSYHDLFENASDAIYIHDAEGNLFDVNEVACKRLGYAKNELINIPMKQFISPISGASFSEHIFRIFREGHQIFESTNITRSGRVIPVEVSARPIKYRGVDAILSFSRDITERNRYERQVMTLHRHAAALAQAGSYDEVCKATLDAIESVIGFHLLAFMAVREEGLISIGNRRSPPLDRALPLDGPGVTVKAARELRSILVKDTRLEPDFVRGPTDSLSELAVPIVVDGQTVGVINMESIELDAFNEMHQKLLETLAMHVASAYERIRESKRIREEEVAWAKELLESADKIYKMVRHDLMSPLQTIRNSSYLLRHSPDKVGELTKTIDDNVEYVVKILDDLKVLAAPREMVRTPMDLCDLVEHSLANIAIPQSIKVERSYGHPVTIQINSTNIRRVIDNLMKNAVEAMPMGGILTVVVDEKDDSVELLVKDTGVGISSERVKDIFKPFYSTKPNGTGLGLAICKQVVEAHGGQIRVESDEGKGTTFTVKLPITRRAAGDGDKEMCLIQGIRR